MENQDKLGGYMRTALMLIIGISLIPALIVSFLVYNIVKPFVSEDFLEEGADE